MLPQVAASLPNLRPANSNNNSFMGAPCYAFVEALFGLRRKKFQMPPPAARTATPITLANFATKTPISASRPSFFATTPPTSAAMRSEERRVGNEGRTEGGRTYRKKEDE